MTTGRIHFAGLTSSTSSASRRPASTRLLTWRRGSRPGPGGRSSGRRFFANSPNRDQRRSARARRNHHERTEFPKPDLGGADVPEPVGTVGEDRVEQDGVGQQRDQLEQHLRRDPARSGVLQPPAFTPDVSRAEVFAAALIVYFSVLGFMSGYLLTRLVLARAFWRLSIFSMPWLPIASTGAPFR